MSVSNVTSGDHCWSHWDTCWLIDHLEDWGGLGGLGRTEGDWEGLGGLGRTGEEWAPANSLFTAVQTNSKSGQSQLHVIFDAEFHSSGPGVFL